MHIPLASPPSAEEILGAINGLLATKYLAACALVCALWDHLINVDKEVQVLWRRKGKTGKTTKIVYVVVRYGSEISLVYVAYMLAGLGNHLSNTFAVMLCLFTVLFTIMSTTYMIFYHFGLWDHGKRVMGILIGILICTYTPVLIMAVLVILVYYENSIYQPVLNTCLVIEQPKFVVAAWGCMCAFDFLTIVLALANSLHRPYRHHIDVLKNFRRDGAIFFIIVFLLRLINMILFAVLPPLDPFVVAFLEWSMVSITLSRLILRIESMKPRHGINTWIPATDSYEMGRWTTLPPALGQQPICYPTPHTNAAIYVGIFYA
ncbi:hypothetical protein NM688_g269 [Phlebia brevispora]|uniref:Uncharacterized protein n=1 Tax=Phlebia brevispora TaxID=194682 RepID=A0ACC1TEH3_9APHY|nr:hypothetical protein NM688_g269 [Phlebia brevispora]